MHWTALHLAAQAPRPDCDVEYHFAQVGVETALVDTGPTCGNMLVGVGPVAILRGLVEAAEKETGIRVWDVNTQSRMHIVVQKPGGVIELKGDASIDGVNHHQVAELAIGAIVTVEADVAHRSRFAVRR